jgi:phosphotriesterase-related protein
MRLAFNLTAFFAICLASSCHNPVAQPFIQTVSGRVSAQTMGATLIHEHLLVDFIGADAYDPHRWQHAEVIDRVLPFLLEIKAKGIHSIVECTPAFLGRDPVLLKTLSERSELNILTNTGLYGAVDNKFLPPFAHQESDRQLADRWIKEWQLGIEDTGIKPAFIKIGVNPGSLSSLHQKLVRAAALTYQRTGLLIVSHTGRAVAAFEQLDILADMGVSEKAFVWVHAQAETNYSLHVAAAKRGAWVSLDGISDNNVEDYLAMVQNMKAHGVLDRTLISHDAGWFSPGELNGGDFRGFTTIPDVFLPMLRSNGFSQAECDLLLVENPANAFHLTGP